MIDDKTYQENKEIISEELFLTMENLSFQGKDDLQEQIAISLMELEFTD